MGVQCGREGTLSASGMDAIAAVMTEQVMTPSPSATTNGCTSIEAHWC